MMKLPWFCHQHKYGKTEQDDLLQQSRFFVLCPFWRCGHSRQLAGLISVLEKPLRYTVAGSAFISIFLMPALAPSTPTTSDGSDTKNHRLQRSLQRTTALTPNAQRTEQSSAARMMAKLESKLAFATLVISGELSGLSTDGLIGEDGRDMFRDSNNLLQ